MTRFEDSSYSVDPHRDPRVDSQILQQQVKRLHRLRVCSRWLVVSGLWLVIAPICLWNLRSEFALWHDYFTWTAVRYTLIFNRLWSIGLLICIFLTLSTAIWQIRQFLGISNGQRRSLEKEVLTIRKQGKTHPLWRWVIGGWR